MKARKSKKRGPVVVGNSADGAPYERTHWDGCWRDRGHFPCAQARIQCLEWEIDTLRAGWTPPADDTYQITPYGADKYEIQDLRAGRSFAITRTRLDAERIIAALAAVSTHPEVR